MAHLRKITASKEPGVERVIGQRLRESRVRQRLTLANLAESTGLSKATLSKIENGLLSSPISTYYRIAEVLGLDGGGLFGEPTKGPLCFVVRKDDRKPASRQTTGHTYSFQALGFLRARKRMEPFILTYPPNQQGIPRYVHTTEEFLYVLKGRLEFHYRGKRFRLKAGDSVYFDARVPHGGRAYGSRPAVALSIAANTP
jgi:mannose-6-phosphate isomerase-like protein (cupin superfamily)